MADPRVEAYARLLVERCIGVQPGWQVLIRSSPVARPLVEEIVKAIGRGGAYPLVRLSYANDAAPFDTVWAREAPLELVGEMAPLDRHTVVGMDALMGIYAPENTKEMADLTAERQQLLTRAARPYLDRTLNDAIPWVLCQAPCPAYAQDAGMSLAAFEDFLYGACLLDWDAEGERMRRYADRFDRAGEVRIVGEGTDLTLSLEGREGIVDEGYRNMPGGEVFYSPLEDSAEGIVHYSEFPASWAAYEAEGIRLVFEGGRVIDASATRNEESLFAALDADEGARRLGELGIGCNPGIQRHMKNTLFDEKMDGTVHLAIGAGIPTAGGTNESSVHWDMVKDLRRGGRLYCDGELVQENGRWLIAA